MSDTERRLAELEAQRSRLLSARNERIRLANEAISRANKEFDRDALPLGRKINELRAQLDAETPKEPTPLVTRIRVHDPEWSDEDIDHYYELVNRGK